MFKRMLGLMASASSVLQLGLLHMRPLHYSLKPRVPPHAWRHGCLRIRVSQAGVAALAPWKDRQWMAWSVPLSMVCRRKVVLTDASSLGWGALCDGKSAFGPWSKKEGYLHINCLEMLAVWSGLRTFLPDLRGHHVLIRSDSMTVVFYINLQDGLASRHLFILAECLLSRVGYRNPVPMWHRYLCNRYAPTRIKTQISVPHFGAMPKRSVKIFVLCFSETDVRSIITGTKCAK